jgi:hypothetical protein
MRVKIEFTCDSASFADEFEASLTVALQQARRKVLRQMVRPGTCVCTAPEADDKILDVNGNTIGTVVVEKP